MVLGFLANALVSAVTLLWSALVLAIPVFLAVWLVGRRLSGFFQNRWHRSWIQSAWLASYGMFFVVLIIAFFVPVWQATRDSSIGVPPEEIRLTLAEQVAQYSYGLGRLLVLSAFFALLALPLVFVGEFFKDALKERIRNSAVRVFAAIWLAMILALFVALFLLSWVVPGLLYLIYWA